MKKQNILSGKVRGAGLATAMVCTVALMSQSAGAQDQQAQLPTAVAQEQIPSAFPGTAEPTQNTTPMPAPMSGQEAQRTAGQNGLSAQSPATAAQAGSATTPAEQPVAIDQLDAAADGEIPPQPEERKLVPATAMGTAAQNADSGTGTPQPQAQPIPVATTGNPVEDAAAAVDMNNAQNADLQPASDDVMAEYARRADEAAAAREDALGDALPEVSTLNMVKLEGADFDGAASGSVEIDPSLAAVKSKKEQEEDIRTEAFDAAITGMFPLSPDQVQSLLKRYDETQGAAKKPVYEDPTPEISVQNVSLDPGVAPPVIKTAVGNVTTLNILDATGAPWPVQDVTWAGDYEIVEPEEGGHIIRITPMSHFARGNIVIRMLTLKTPLTMRLETGRDIVQYRVDARIPEYGPFATAPIMQGGKSLVAGSPDLTSLLDGVMPGGMSKLRVSGVDGRTTAYEMNGTTYVRTPLTLLSPAWQSSVSSADGMNVYALASAPVLLLSDGGEFVRATISEKEDLLDE